jgi:hypothetical protein
MERFIAAIPNYTAIRPAPIVIKTVGATVKTGNISLAPIEKTDVILRLKVKKEMVPRLTEVLHGVDGVVVL